MCSDIHRTRIMKKFFYAMVPNEQIFFEESNAWFVNHNENILYRISISTEECKEIARIPNGKSGLYRANPLCLKYKDDIICLPVSNECIWFYNLKCNEFEKMKVENPQTEAIGFRWAWIIDATLWAWASGLKQLVEINLESREIENCYKISNDAEEKFAYQVINVDESIYLFENKRKILYEFDTAQKQTIEHGIPQIRMDVNTICYFQGAFWFSGTGKCIYIWEKDSDKLTTLCDFPKEFQIKRSEKRLTVYQRAIFYLSININQYICFIPWDIPKTVCTGVLFVNRKTHQMKVIKLYNEECELKESFHYSLEYIRDDRYIGIYYSRNAYISEIDTETFAVAEKRMKFSRESYTKIFQNSGKHGMFQEKNPADLEAFIEL